MGPYELAISKISDLLDNYDLSEFTDNEVMSISFNDIIECIREMHTTLKDINDIIENIGGI